MARSTHAARELASRNAHECGGRSRKGGEVTLPRALRMSSAEIPALLPDAFAVSRPMYGKVRTHRGWAGEGARDPHRSRALGHGFVISPSLNRVLAVPGPRPPNDLSPWTR